MKKLVSRAGVLLATAVLLVVASTSSALGAEITVSPQRDDNVAKVIQAELDKSPVLGTSTAPYVVNVAPGSYVLDRSLKLYSNVELNLTGVTFTLKPNTKSNMIRLGESDDQRTGYFYENISVNGGVFDANKGTSTVLKAAHAKNVSFRGATFRNCFNSHLAEVAGIDGFTVKNCVFRDQVRDNSQASKVMSPEALQIDILNKIHFPTYRAEDLTMKNVLIEDTKFINVPRGVGSHTGVYNNPMTNITVNRCTFSNIDTVAIEFQNVVDLTVSNNVINSAPRGIGINTIGTQGMFFSQSIAKEGGTPSRYTSSYKAPAADQKIVIRNNTIVCKGKDPHTGFENEAIVLKGSYSTDVPKGSKQMDALPKKDHYLSGVLVEKNNIKTIGHGIRLRDGKKSSIKNNKIVYIGSQSGTANYYGVQLIGHATGNVIVGNTVSSIKTNGIYISDKSSATLVQGNKITKPGKYGIAVQDSAVDKIVSNSVSSPRTHGIHVFKSSTAKLIQGNTLSAPGHTGINVEQGSRVTLVQRNTINAPKIAGVFLHHSSVVTHIKGNTIAKSKKYGIFAETKSTAKNISDNKISSAALRGIYITSAASNVRITKNSVSCLKGNAIYLDTKSSKYSVVVKGNKLTGKASTANVKIKSGKVQVSGSKKAK